MKKQNQDLYLPFFVIIQIATSIVPSDSTPLITFWALGLGSLIMEKGVGALLFSGTVSRWVSLGGHILLQVEAWMYVVDFFRGASSFDLRIGVVGIVFWMSVLGGAAFIGRFFQKTASEEVLTKVWMGAFMVAAFAAMLVPVTAVIGGGIFSAPVATTGPIIMACGMICVMSLVTAGVARGMIPG